MKKGGLLLYLSVITMCCSLPAWARPGLPPPIVALGDLEKRPAVETGVQSMAVDAGGGVSWQMAPGPGLFQQNLAVMADGRQMQVLEGGVFTGYARLQEGAGIYWVLAEYSGGAHCCAHYHFFSRPAAGRPVQYLGRTAGHNGWTRPLQELFLYREGRLYFKSLDNRFDYFHASHADCLLVNYPPVYYLLAPTELKIDNLFFKDRYLEEVGRVEADIGKQLAGRGAKPPAILQPMYGKDYGATGFADDLGQLLVKRSLLFLYAREDQKAWQTLEADVGKYYQTGQWLPELRREIQEMLAESPY
jgi:hypothetical protein